MNSKSIDWRLPVLIGVLLVVALLINVFFFTQATARREKEAEERRQASADVEAQLRTEKLAQEKEVAEKARQLAIKETEARRVRIEAEEKANAEELRRKAVENAAAEHARFLARYLNPGFVRKPELATIAVAVESETGTMNPTIANALTRRLQTADVRLLNSFFRPEFIADKFPTAIFSGDTGIFDRLELTNCLNGVLIGQQTVTYSTNAALESTITANMRLQLMVLPVGLTRENQSWHFAANGVGFRPEEARQMAEERLVEQITKSTNVTLAPRF